MNFNREIKFKLDRLIGIMLSDGVQPNDLANNIFLKDYEKISYTKKDGMIIGELLFYDDEEVTMRYVYNFDMKLMRVEEEVKGKVIVEWDRTIVENTLIQDIVDLMKIHYSHEQINKFISSLPKELQERIENDYQKIA
ncbi:MAG: hypothetical protein KAX49_13820 [Halanaerobiales bacterium]|nr:hypothetical protein [Halanaerobiales bacterium]